MVKNLTSFEINRIFALMIYRYLVSLYLALMFLATSVVFIVVTTVLFVLTCWYDKRLKLLHLFACFWASCYTWLNPLWRVKISGLEHIDRHKVYVMVSNHQSVADILVIYRIFRHFKWVAKSSLFRIPVIGWNLQLNRYIRVERNMKSQRKMFRLCEKNIRRGSSLMIFPEGTRSPDGQLRSFKGGAFLIAAQQQTDIVPMVIDGTAHLIPRNRLHPFYSQTIRLHILPPVPYKVHATMSVQETADYVRQLVNEELIRMRNPIPPQN
ncbi:MAG: 1-acyl-sn-glycerol-3-phosphate acyltransferase [Bacteroidales bacterium]|jgi:1-acyl-sn-glycerol-3-phosphate acyltransferase|nr:1-acyl-sn-glycerol-3-phosphate acyltransferase [Bacteroidales bacterium]